MTTLQAGDVGPVISHTLNRTDFVRYAGASGDYNPMHHDEPKAVAARQPSVFGHGMLSAGILGRAITDWVGVAALQTYKVRFATQTWPDDTVSTHLEVTEVRTEDGVQLADLTAELRNQDGAPVITGSAVIRLDAVVAATTEGA